MPHPVTERLDDLTGDLRPLAEPAEWLEALADPDQVLERVRDWVPGAVTCQVVRVRIKSDGATAVYRVGGSGAGEAGETAVELRGTVVSPGQDQPPAGVVGQLGSPDWTCSLPELHLVLTAGSADAALPALPALTAPASAARLIGRAIAASSPRYAGFHVISCRPRVTRHKAGSRCTVVYDLTLPSSAPADWPREVVAKTYWGDKGRVAWDGMRALWDSPLRRSETVAIAEPLAFLDEQRVLLQRAIPHQTTLKELVRSTLVTGEPGALGELLAIIDRSARGLAELHASGAVAAQTLSWTQEMAEVRGVIDRLASLVPSLDGTAAALLAELERMASVSPPQPPVPSHGSFRPAQVVVQGGGIGFIDFDGFCMTEPARDAALFCASLRDTALRALPSRGDPEDGDSHLALVDELCQGFLAAYDAAAPLSAPRVALWETLDALTAVLHCWTKVKFDRLPYRMALLQHRLRRGLDGW